MDTALNRSVFFRLLVLVNLVARPFGRLYAHKYRLALPEWRVLLMVAAQPGITASQAAEFIGLDKMAVSRAVRTLEAAGRLQRAAVPGDRRAATLALTPAGEALQRAILPSGQAREAQLLAALSPEEQEVFGRLLDKLVAHARLLPDGDDQNA